WINIVKFTANMSFKIQDVDGDRNSWSRLLSPSLSYSLPSFLHGQAGDTTGTVNHKDKFKEIQLVKL
uniref:DUF1080 domain-containing protein n=1 Tax=Strongyloides papillosus TaxID=174720 RepID=A0A0N5C7X4_STREA